MRCADPVREPCWLAEAEAVRRELGIKGEVTLVRSDRISMPMAWSVVRSAIILPTDSQGWTPARRRVVLLHEMAHLKRRDCQTLLVARVVAALHWFNPLAWIATRRLQAERERACDDLVLSAGTRGPDYAQHLLEIARALRSSSPAWATVAMARPSELEGRLLAILDPDRDRRRATRAASVIGVVAAGLLVFPLAALQPWAEAVESVQDAERIIARVQLRIQEQIKAKIRLQIETHVESNLDLQIATEIDPDVAERIRAAVIVRAQEISVEDWADAMEVDESIVEAAIEQAMAAASAYEFGFRLSGAQQSASTNPRVMEAFTTALRDDDAEIRATAAQALGEIEDPSAVAVLAEAHQGDEAARVRAQAAWALGMIESDAGVPALTAAMSDTEARVRSQAAWALGMIESAVAADVLGSALQADDSADVRQQAAWALGMIEDDGAVSALGNAVQNDTEADVRSQAAWALGMIESSESIAAVSAALAGDESARVRRQAAWALGMIDDVSALDVLLDAMTDDDLDVRKKALWAIGQISG